MFLTPIGYLAWLIVIGLCEPRTFRCTSWIYKRQRNQRSNCQHSLDHTESKRIPRKHLLHWLHWTPLTVCIETNWKILKEMGIPDHLTCLLRNLYAGQAVTIRTRPGTTDWFKIRKRVQQGCIVSLCLFNICRVHHAKCQAGWLTSWNQDCQEKYQ